MNYTLISVDSGLIPVIPCMRPGRMPLNEKHHRQEQSTDTVLQTRTEPPHKADAEKVGENISPRVSMHMTLLDKGLSQGNPQHSIERNVDYASWDQEQVYGGVQDLANQALVLSEDWSRFHQPFVQTPDDVGPAGPLMDEATPVPSLETEQDVLSGQATNGVAPSCSQAITGATLLPPEPPTSDITASVDQSGTDAQQCITERHLHEVAADCFVDLLQPLPDLLAQEWNRAIHQELRNSLYHQLPDTDVTIECVMTQHTRKAQAKPTVLLMYSDGARKKHLQRILRESKIPHHFHRKAVLLDVELCSPKVSGKESSAGRTSISQTSVNSAELTGVASGETLSILPQTEETELRVDSIIGDVSDGPAIFARRIKIHPVTRADLFAISTIGGFISVNGSWYGLTTAHALQIMGTERQQMTKVLGTVHGHKVYSSLFDNY